MAADDERILLVLDAAKRLSRKVEWHDNGCEVTFFANHKPIAAGFAETAETALEMAIEQLEENICDCPLPGCSQPANAVN